MTSQEARIRYCDLLPGDVFIGRLGYTTGTVYTVLAIKPSERYNGCIITLMTMGPECYIPGDLTIHDEWAGSGAFLERTDHEFLPVPRT